MTVRSAKASGLPPATLTPMGTLLFSASEPGAWYDPSDMSTLFQDSAGTTPVTAVEQPVGRMLDKSGRGNHATQATTTKRPVLSRRVNLLTKTEQPNDDVWVKTSGVTISTGHSDPLGGTSACLLSIPPGGGVYVLETAATASRVAAVSVRKAVGSAAAIMLINSPNGQGYSLSFDTASISESWTRLVSPPSNTATRNGFRFYNASTTETAVFYAWGASLTLAIDSHLPYQRVNTDTDYDADPAKFPAYLRCDGVDDAMATAGNVNLTSSDKLFVCAGVTKLTDANLQMIAELSANAAGPPGSFWLLGGNNSVGTEGWGAIAGGTTRAQFTAGDSVAPNAAVVSLRSDIAAPVNQLRVKGVLVTQTLATQGTGNYGNYPLYLFARNSSSLYFSGRFYGLVLRGGPSTLTQIEAAETYMRGRMKL